MADDILFTSAGDLGQQIAAREISPVEICRAVLARIEALQPRLNAFITVAADQAMADAKAAETRARTGQRIGALDGIPYSVKDLINTAGTRTTFGSHAHSANVPAKDALCIARLRAAGAVLIGKTTTPEFGHKPLTEAPLFGRTLNPWDQTRTCGGSSGGAAVAVAAGMAPLAVGTDGGGSTRIPAAACGVVGFKQSLGVVPHDQTPDVFGLLAYMGPIARNVADAAMMLDVMKGPDASDPHSLGREIGSLEAAVKKPEIKGKKIGWRQYLGNEHLSVDTDRLFQAGLARFRDMGAELVELNDDFPDTLPIWGPLTFSIWASRFGALEQQLGDKMSHTLRHWMAQGRQASAVQVQDAMAVRTTLYRQVEGWFQDIDLLLTPTLTRGALAADQDPFAAIEIDGVAAGGLRDGWYPYTHPFNLSGHPAITLPMGFDGDGLPLGLQIVGPWFGDERIFQAARAFELAQPWADQRPALD